MPCPPIFLLEREPRGNKLQEVRERERSSTKLSFGRESNGISRVTWSSCWSADDNRRCHRFHRGMCANFFAGVHSL